jgi:hypothetical protein
MSKQRDIRILKRHHNTHRNARIVAENTPYCTQQLTDHASVKKITDAAALSI